MQTCNSHLSTCRSNIEVPNVGCVLFKGLAIFGSTILRLADEVKIILILTVHTPYGASPENTSHQTIS